MHTQMHTYTHACTYTHLHLHPHPHTVHPHPPTHHEHMNVFKHKPTCDMHACTCMWHACMHMHRHTDTQTNRHTHTPNYAHYIASYIVFQGLWTQKHKRKQLQAHIRAQTGRRDTHAYWQVLGQGTEHDSFEYKMAHHSWRQFYRVSVCVKLSYARGSWQTSVHTNHSPHQALGLLLSLVWVLGRP